MKWTAIGEKTSAAVVPSGIALRCTEDRAYEPVNVATAVALMHIPCDQATADAWIEKEEKAWKREQRKA
jgi:hypothetical protein